MFFIYFADFDADPSLFISRCDSGICVGGCIAIYQREQCRRYTSSGDEIREAIESIKGVQPGGKAHDQAIKAMQVLSRAKARAGGQHWTTPLVAGNYMYLFAQDGNASVLKLDGDVDDANQRVIHRHEFKGEVFLGSPAATGDAIYMRSDKYLYKFAKEPA